MTIESVAPDTPSIAQEQRITGVVEVGVILRADGSIDRLDIRKSPSEVLDGPSLTAASRSIFQTAFQACMPVPSAYVYRVEYTWQ